MTNFIKVNSIGRYGHIADEWEVEDRAFKPQVRNSKTGHIAEWIPQRGRGFGLRACVTMKDGRQTTIALDTLSDEYESRHPFG